MFEPLTLTLAELAARWGLTPRQVLQHAQQPGVPLYFAYEGLVFDVGDHWHRHGGDWTEARSYDSLERSIKDGETHLQRRKVGQLTEWNDLTQDEAIELRSEIEASKVKLRSIKESLEKRDAERNRCHFRGYLRAAPSTLWDIESLGAAPFPHKAFHPSSSIAVVHLPDAPDGAGGMIWDGRLVSLEPMSAGDQRTKPQLMADDLMAITPEVRAIEERMRARDEEAKTVLPLSTSTTETGAMSGTERNKLLKHIGGLALLLAEKSSLYKNGQAPNAFQIATAVTDLLKDAPDMNVSGAGISSVRDSIKEGLELLKK